MINQAHTELAARVCREVAELPDRNSPEDWPEAMLVTHDELRAIVLAALRASSPAEPAPQFDHAALYRAMHLASMLAGSVGMSNVAESQGHSNDLRAHLSQFIVTKESSNG